LAILLHMERRTEMGFADDWGAVYNKSILAFTGRNKVAVRELEDVVKGTGPLATALAGLDQNDPEQGKIAERPARYKAFVAEQKPMKKAGEKYAAVLDKAIKATDKDIHPEAYRELKVLRKHLDFVASKVETKAVKCSKEYDKAQTKLSEAIEKAQTKLREEGLDDAEINIETDFLKQQRALLGWPAITKTALAKAVVAVQKVKADPTPDTYKTAMDQGGRDMTQQMSNLVKLITDTKCPASLKRQVAEVSAYRQTLADFGNGAKRQVANDASREQVLAQVQEFSQLCKAMMPIYEKMVKYLSKHKL
jgi:hypothetical protein